MEQQNPYIKQFPDLFKGKTILYVHGFASSAQSGSVTRIRQVLPSARVVAYDIPLHPQEAITLLNNNPQNLRKNVQRHHHIQCQQTDDHAGKRAQDC